MVNLSSAMGRKFAEEATQISEDVQALGPSPLRRTTPSPARQEQTT
jgi:coenzyme F420-reducing hydrogenase delta subunit